jgi:hypothetical protein
MIKFASMSGEYQHNNIFKMRNNVVHELGHLFNISIEARGWDTPYDVLARDMETNRDLRRGTDQNETYGFASPGNIVTWQQHSCYMDDLSKPYPPCILSGEIFADQFLGWTYDAWDGTFDPVTQTYKLSDRGRARSDWMDENMRKWLIKIFGRSNR